jgi:hypothetical protein
MIRTLFLILLISYCNWKSAVIEGQNSSVPISSENNRSPEACFGGELRGRLRNFNVINFGDVSASENDYDTYLNLRASFFSDLYLNRTFSIYTQVCSATTIGKDNTSSSDKDILGLSQAFADIRLHSLPVGFQVGRQLINLGSGRIFGTSDGPNVTKTFDGLRSTVSLENDTVELIFVTPVRIGLEILDNKVNTSDYIYGAYWIKDLNNDHALDLYFFGNHLKDITFDNINENENRFTLGGRISKSAGAFFFDAEAAWQLGNRAIQKISAFYVSSAAGYCWLNSRFKPLVQIRGSVYSGSKDSTDKRINLFRPVSARPPINNMVPFGPSNLILLVPEGEIYMTNKILFNLRYYALWRYAGNDGLYSTRMEQMTREPDKIDNKLGLFITNGFTIQVEYDLSEHMNLSFTSGLYFPGKYIRNTGKGMNTQANFMIARYSF